MEKTKIYCKICEIFTEFDVLENFIRSHLKKVHKQTPKEYYDEFLKSSLDNICKNPGCSNETKFHSLGEGYRKYCCNKCTQSDPNFLKQRQEKYFQKTGYHHPRENPEVKKRVEQKNLEILGETSFFKTKEFKEKRKNSIKKRFGTEEYFQSEEFKKFHSLNKDRMVSNMKSSMIEKYGVDNIMKTDVGLKNRNKNNLEKYGVENVFASEKIKNIIAQTNIEKYGFPHHNSNEGQKQKSRDFYNRMTPEEKEERRLKIIQSKYDGFLNIIDPILNQGYELIKYDVQDKHILKCPLNHEFKIQGQLLIDRVRRPETACAQCNPILKPVSFVEKQLYQFVKSNFEEEVLENVYGLIDERMELDVYIPSKKLGFEFNGLFWHNETNKGRTYHKNKTDLYENEGIQIIHIYEDDWNVKKDIVQSRILNLLNKTPNTIHARKCTIKEVDYKEAEIFLNNNHIQGNCVSKIRIGLYYNNELVSLMTFSKPRRNMGYKNTKDVFELLRFCNKINTNVVGGASKLFKYFIKEYEFKEVISYADRSWSQGKLYEILGFTFISKTKPNYWYVKDGIRENRFKYQKWKLVELGGDSSKTEEEIMRELRIDKIFDSGSLLFKYTK